VKTHRPTWVQPAALGPVDRCSLADMLPNILPNMDPTKLEFPGLFESDFWAGRWAAEAKKPRFYLKLLRKKWRARQDLNLRPSV